MFLVRMLLPLYYPAGKGVPQSHFSDIRGELTQRFGGMTAYLRSPAQGTWREPGGGINRDEMVMCEVMVDELDRERWSAYRKQLEGLFDQEELVVLCQPAGEVVASSARGVALYARHIFC